MEDLVNIHIYLFQLITLNKLILNFKIKEQARCVLMRSGLKNKKNQASRNF